MGPIQSAEGQGARERCHCIAVDQASGLGKHAFDQRAGRGAVASEQCAREDSVGERLVIRAARLPADLDRLSGRRAGAVQIPREEARVGEHGGGFALGLPLDARMEGPHTIGSAEQVRDVAHLVAEQEGLHIIGGQRSRPGGFDATLVPLGHLPFHSPQELLPLGNT